jgi:hypothetical protein
VPRGDRNGVFFVHRMGEEGLPVDPSLWDVNYIDSDW